MEGGREQVVEVLGAPLEYTSTTHGPGSCLLLASKGWLASLLATRSLPSTFPTPPSLSPPQLQALLADNRSDTFMSGSVYQT